MLSMVRASQFSDLESRKHFRAVMSYVLDTQTFIDSPILT